MRILVVLEMTSQCGNFIICLQGLTNVATLILSWIEPITQQRLQQALTLPYMVMRDTSGLLIKLSK